MIRATTAANDLTVGNDGVSEMLARGLDEDGAEHSFAGQHDIVLGVTTLDELERSVLRCWASAFSERAEAYHASLQAGAAPAGERGDVLLSSAELSALVRETLELEAALGEPLDLEWAIAPTGRSIGCRPAPSPPRSRKTTPASSGATPTPVSCSLMSRRPMTLDLVKGVVKTLFSLFTEELDIDWDRTPIVGLVGGRIYFSAESGLALVRVGEQLRAAGLSGFIESRDWPGLERVLAAHPHTLTFAPRGTGGWSATATTPAPSSTWPSRDGERRPRRC